MPAWLITMLISFAIKVAMWILKKEESGEPLNARQKELLNQFIWVAEEKIRPTAVRMGCLSLGTQPPEWNDYPSSSEE